MDIDYSYQIVFSEVLGGIARGAVSMGIGVQTDIATPVLARFGSGELRCEFLVSAIAGDAVFSIAVREPHAGFNVAAIKTKAKMDSGDYLISGTTMWITNSTQAANLCLLIPVTINGT